ncbi:MAG: type II toxin-antitoxin system VapC family toxin [Gammaproteobacteria bacterium]|nr:type II toxin-antitoxin system VapC family toxin [Gammaproteobacteria bacterium]
MILLDTYNFIWLVADQTKLSKTVRLQLSRNPGKIFLSAISAYEIGIKFNKKLIELPLTPNEWVQKALQFHGITELPISSKIAVLATQLPQLHTNFIDRVIIATALEHNLTVVTANKNIHSYPKLNYLE